MIPWWDDFAPWSDVVGFLLPIGLFWLVVAVRGRR